MTSPANITSPVSPLRIRALDVELVKGINNSLYILVKILHLHIFQPVSDESLVLGSFLDHLHFKILDNHPMTRQLRIIATKRHLVNFFGQFLAGHWFGNHRHESRNSIG